MGQNGNSLPIRYDISGKSFQIGDKWGVDVKLLGDCGYSYHHNSGPIFDDAGAAYVAVDEKMREIARLYVEMKREEGASK